MSSQCKFTIVTNSHVNNTGETQHVKPVQVLHRDQLSREQYRRDTTCQASASSPS